MIGHPQGERLMTWVDQSVEEAELKDGEEDEDHAHLHTNILLSPLNDR